MYALLLEKHKHAYRAIIFDVDEDGCASVADIVEASNLQAVEDSIHWANPTHVRFNDQYIQPDCLSVVEAAEVIMYTRLLQEEVHDKKLAKELAYSNWDMSKEGG